MYLRFLRCVNISSLSFVDVGARIGSHTTRALRSLWTSLHTFFFLFSCSPSPFAQNKELGSEQLGFLHLLLELAQLVHHHAEVDDNEAAERGVSPRVMKDAVRKAPNGA